MRQNKHINDIYCTILITIDIHKKKKLIISFFLPSMRNPYANIIRCAVNCIILTLILSVFLCFWKKS